MMPSNDSVSLKIFLLVHTLALHSSSDLAFAGSFSFFRKTTFKNNNNNKSKGCQCTSSLGNLEIYGRLKAIDVLKEGGVDKELKSKRLGKNSVFWNFSVFPLKYRMYSEFCATWWIAKKKK